MSINCDSGNSQHLAQQKSITFYCFLLSMLPPPSLTMVTVFLPNFSPFLFKLLKFGVLQGLSLEFLLYLYLLLGELSQFHGFKNNQQDGGSEFITLCQIFFSEFQTHLPKFFVIIYKNLSSISAAAKSLQSCLTLCDPIDGSPPGSDVPGILETGKNAGVGCHFLLQCMKVKSESEVFQLCLTLCDPMDFSLPGSPFMGFSRQEYWNGLPVPSPLGISTQICNRQLKFTCLNLSHPYSDAGQEQIK